MRTIYIVASRTNTRLGTLIRIATGFRYNHVSLALSSDLTPMYSFSRYHQTQPFYGGFVEESMRRYLMTDEDFEYVCYEVPVTAAAYEHLCHHLARMQAQADKYRYSFIKAGSSYFSFLKYDAGDACTCLSFVNDVLRLVGVLSDGQDYHSIRALCQFLEIFPHEARVLTRCHRQNYAWHNDPYLASDWDMSEEG